VLDVSEDQFAEGGEKGRREEGSQTAHAACTTGNNSVTARNADALPRGHELNAICPYFTMFPLKFPLQILLRHSNPLDRVLDPFCGRGTTNFAARLVGLYSVGMDISPVAQAITQAKLVWPTPRAIETELAAILANSPQEVTPVSEFWH
jgi:DNA methylase